MRSLAFLLCTSLLAAQAPLQLPPQPEGGPSLADALRARATSRALKGPGLTRLQAAQLLWAAQGENRPGRRTVPSAHAKYPLELYLLTAGGPDLPAGTYHYLPAGNRLERLGDGTPEGVLGAVKGMQGWIKDAPAVFVVAGDPSRLGAAGPGAVNYTFYEAGAAAQDLLLQAAALGLGAGTASGVNLEAVARALKLGEGVQAVALLPVGRLR